MDVPTAKTATGYLLSAALCAQGIRCILDPLNASADYGIPASPQTTNYEYVPVMGARNVALGLCVGTFMFQGERRAAGTVLCTALLIGVFDTWATFKHQGKWRGSVLSHAIGDGVFAGAGWWLTR
jgi:hypothetical protein